MGAPQNACKAYAHLGRLDPHHLATGDLPLKEAGNVSVLCNFIALAHSWLWDFFFFFFFVSLTLSEKASGNGGKGKEPLAPGYGVSSIPIHSLFSGRVSFHISCLEC